MPKTKTKKLSSIEKLILSDLEKQLEIDKREEKSAQKLFEKSFKEKFEKSFRRDARLEKKKKVESRKINLKTKRKLKKSKLKKLVKYDQNNIMFKPQQQEFFLAVPIVITLEFLENDFVNFLFATYSNDIVKFTNKFNTKTKKNKFTFSIGYHFFFEGLQGNKTFEVGFREKEEMPTDANSLIIVLQGMLTDIKKRFQIYYNRANSHILKFQGLTLEATPKN